MDPMACYRRMVEACEAGDMSEAADAATDLDGWRMGSGFRPDGIPADVWVQGALRDFARICRAVARSIDATA